MIRRLLGLFGLLVVVTMLTLTAAPAGAGDASVTASGGTEQGTAARSTRARFWRITGHSCPAFNQARIRVRQDETGVSGTNYFQQVYQGQVFKNGAWRNRGGSLVRRSNQFANNGANWFFHPNPVTLTWNNEFAFSHRILVKLRWWNNAGSPGFFGDDFVVGSAAVFQRCG